VAVGSGRRRPSPKAVHRHLRRPACITPEDKHGSCTANAQLSHTKHATGLDSTVAPCAQSPRTVADTDTSCVSLPCSGHGDMPESAAAPPPPTKHPMQTRASC
jgi:hypothetical protein